MSKQLRELMAARLKKGEVGDTFEEVLREEMRMMKEGYELKIELMQKEVCLLSVHVVNQMLIICCLPLQFQAFKRKRARAK